MEYIASTIALLATCVGVIGGNPKKNARNPWLLTPIGWIALTLALAAFAVSVVQTYSARSSEALRRLDANEVLLDAAGQVAMAIYSGSSFHIMFPLDEAVAHTESRLKEVGGRIDRILRVYGDAIPERARKPALSIAQNVTENANLIGNRYASAGYLSTLDAQLRELAMSLDGSRIREVIPSPLRDYKFDFDKPGPRDPRLK